MAEKDWRPTPAGWWIRSDGWVVICDDPMLRVTKAWEPKDGLVVEDILVFPAAHVDTGGGGNGARHAGIDRVMAWVDENHPLPKAKPITIDWSAGVKYDVAPALPASPAQLDPPWTEATQDGLAGTCWKRADHWMVAGSAAWAPSLRERAGEEAEVIYDSRDAHALDPRASTVSICDWVNRNYPLVVGSQPRLERAPAFRPPSDIWNDRSEYGTVMHHGTAPWSTVQLQYEYEKVAITAAEALSLRLGQRFRGGVVTGIAHPAPFRVQGQPWPPDTYEATLLVGPPEAVERMAEDSCPHCGRRYDPAGKDG